VNTRTSTKAHGGYTLAETVVAVGLLGLVSASVFAAMSNGFATGQLTRENVRATQVLAQTMEVIRLCNWTQTDPATNFVPTSFTVPYYTDNATVTNGPYYQLSVSITNPPALNAAYSNDMRMIQVQASWSSGNVQHTRTMSSFISEWGLQNYVW
jgi:type II secretory pathway pseudopilin PulG